jgi:hypothetical protein
VIRADHNHVTSSAVSALESCPRTVNGRIYARYGCHDENTCAITSVMRKGTTLVQSRSRTGTTLGLMPAMGDINARHWFPTACIKLLRWVYSVHTPISTFTCAPAPSSFCILLLAIALPRHHGRQSGLSAAIPSQVANALTSSPIHTSNTIPSLNSLLRPPTQWQRHSIRRRAPQNRPERQLLVLPILLHDLLL